jgi:hypothetical protein
MTTLYYTIVFCFLVFGLIVGIVERIERHVAQKRLREEIDRINREISTIESEQIQTVVAIYKPVDDPTNQRRIEEQNRKDKEEAEGEIELAKSAIDRDSANPFENDLLLKAIDHYQKSYQLIERNSCLSAIAGIQQEIDRRYEFQALYRTATENFYGKNFEKALTFLLLAKEIYAPPKLIATILDCEQQSQAERVYIQSLAEAKLLSYAGKFRDALTIVDAAVAKFKREDGEDLKIKLSRVIAAKEQFNLGKIEESIGNIPAAKEHYLAALNLMPGWSEPKLKLAILAIQIGTSKESIEQLATVDYPQVTCLKGLLYIRERQYAKAREIWSPADLDLVQEYWHSTSTLMLAQFKVIQPQIEQLVAQDELEQARILSLNFINEVGGNSLVKNNLKNCINPGIEAKIWRSQDWKNLALLAHENWRNNPTIASLHNLTVAQYYAAKIDNNIEELLICWSTAIANIDLNPTLKNLPWMGTKSVSIEDVADKLWQLLEQQIEEVKKINLDEYFRLRDRYRQEFCAIKLAKLDSTAKISIGELTIPPGFYRDYYSHIPLSGKPQVWQTLYTKWGTAVAACLERDPQRSEIIRSDLAVNSSLEEFAEHFVLYEQGCYYLQQENWRRAIYPLNDAKNAILEHRLWQRRLNDICTERRKVIYDLDEHMDFATFWDDLLSSSESEDYLVQYKASKIQLDWSEDRVVGRLSLSRIKSLLNKYPNHLVVKQIYIQINEYELQNQT